MFLERVLSWDVEADEGVTIESLAPVLDAPEPVDILVVGCGQAFAPPPKGLRENLREVGIGLEWMDTGAACRTFNVLLIEDRQVAAALIAVD